VKEIVPPVVCPACSSELELVNDQLFCRNNMCPAQWDKKVEGFTSTLKIKGFGPATISKLQVQDYSEIYELTVEDLQRKLGSEKLAQKLHSEIEKSKSAKLVDLLPAFSIPLIGKSASTKLCSVISHIEDITPETCQEAGIGPKATENLLRWLEMEYYLGDYKTILPFKWNNKIIEKKEVTGVVCITGKLKSYSTKSHAQKVLEQYGFAVKSSLTKDVSILVNESGIESAKTQAARDRGVQIITNLNKFLGEINHGITKMD
jgi:DNA ligase (NAD+)